MARASRWNQDERASLLKMVRKGITEQEIRTQFTTKSKDGATREMSAVEFAQQLKQAMVESGDIKQTSASGPAVAKTEYQVTETGRLTVSDFSQVTGTNSGDKYVIQSPRGRSKAWRLVKMD